MSLIEEAKKANAVKENLERTRLTTSALEAEIIEIAKPLVLEGFRLIEPEYPGLTPSYMAGFLNRSYGLTLEEEDLYLIMERMCSESTLVSDEIHTKYMINHSSDADIIRMG